MASVMTAEGGSPKPTSPLQLVIGGVKVRPPNASFASSVPAEAAPDEVYPSNWPLVADTAFIYEHRPQKRFRPVYMAKLECSVGAESFVWVFERVGWCPKGVAFLPRL